MVPPAQHHPTRCLPSPALTDWLMVMPSIFRAGTCFMGFSAWNSSENCEQRAPVAWVAWPVWLEQNQASRKALGLLPSPAPPSPGEGPGSQAPGEA